MDILSYALAKKYAEKTAASDVVPRVGENGNWWVGDIDTGVSASGGASYKIGEGLKLDLNTNTLSVDTATEVEADNTKPITAAAVHETVGNIEALLGTI